MSFTHKRVSLLDFLAFNYHIQRHIYQGQQKDNFSDHSNILMKPLTFYPYSFARIKAVTMTTNITFYYGRKRTITAKTSVTETIPAWVKNILMLEREISKYIKHQSTHKVILYSCLLHTIDYHILYNEYLFFVTNSLFFYQKVDFDSFSLFK